MLWEAGVAWARYGDMVWPQGYDVWRSRYELEIKKCDWMVAWVGRQFQPRRKPHHNLDVTTSTPSLAQLTISKFLDFFPFITKHCCPHGGNLMINPLLIQPRSSLRCSPIRRGSLRAEVRTLGRTTHPLVLSLQGQCQLETALCLDCSPGALGGLFALLMAGLQPVPLHNIGPSWCRSWRHVAPSRSCNKITARNQL